MDSCFIKSDVPTRKVTSMSNCAKRKHKITFLPSLPPYIFANLIFIYYDVLELGVLKARTWQAVF